MRVPDAPGEAPGGLLGGRKIMFFVVFFHVFRRRPGGPEKHQQREP